MCESKETIWPKFSRTIHHANDASSNYNGNNISYAFRIHFQWAFYLFRRRRDLTINTLFWCSAICILAMIHAIRYEIQPKSIHVKTKPFNSKETPLRTQFAQRQKHQSFHRTLIPPGINFVQTCRVLRNHFNANACTSLEQSHTRSVCFQCIEMQNNVHVAFKNDTAGKEFNRRYSMNATHNSAAKCWQRIMLRFNECFRWIEWGIFGWFAYWIKTIFVNSTSWFHLMSHYIRDYFPFNFELRHFWKWNRNDWKSLGDRMWKLRRNQMNGVIMKPIVNKTDCHTQQLTSSDI